MTASERNDDAEQDSIGFDVPDGVDTEEIYPVYDDHTGAGHVTVPPGDAVDGDVTLHGTPDADVHVSISGEWFDEGEPPRVNASLIAGPADVRLSMSPERAREIAGELRLAATHAEQGDLEAGEADE